ncbi:type II secretion system F family protein [Neomoorella thermoacetica]|uniref:type II secretion system F family protein n=1 Tax=Neomoorella thermoacetica TaxID=1525 RepID=UPI0030CB81DB
MNQIALASVFAALAILTPSLKNILNFDSRQVRETLCRTGLKWVSEDERTSLARKLAQAGLEMDPAYFAGLRLALVAGAIVLLLPLMAFGLDFFWLVLLAPLLYFVPNMWLNEKAGDRKSAIRLSLADFSVLFSTALSAGADLPLALTEAARSVGGPLAEEVGRVMRDYRVGKNLADALEEMAERCDVDELRALARVIVQSYRYGAPLAEAMKSHAAQMRMVRRYEIMEAAGKLSVKITVPILLCMLVPVMMTIGFPAVVKLMEAFNF